MDGKNPDSNVVELILAVDLDPTNPEEPINVGDVKVAPKGGDDATDNKLVDQLLAAIAKIDPDLAFIVKDNAGNPRAAVRAIEKHADKAPEDAQDEGDSFDRAQAKKPERRAEEPRDEWKPKPRKEFDEPRDEWKPKPRREFDEPRDDFEPKKKFGGGFKGASDRAFGREPKDDFAGGKEPFEPKKRFDDEEDDGFKQKKGW